MIILNKWAGRLASQNPPVAGQFGGHRLRGRTDREGHIDLDRGSRAVALTRNPDPLR